MKPLVIELFCGTFGWSAGWLELGGRAIGFDIEHLPHHGPVPSGAELVLQDVRTLHGRQFTDASLILASPPCQEFSYRAMPWKRAKALGPPFLGMELFAACFRIQREACEAAGRYIPMVVENVKGAQPWVGRAKAHFGSFYLWGDVESVGGAIVAGGVRFGNTLRAGRATPKRALDDVRAGVRRHADDGMMAEAIKNNGGSWFNIAHNTESGLANNPVSIPAGRKVPGFNFHEHEKTGKPGRSFQSAAVAQNGLGPESRCPQLIQSEGLGNTDLMEMIFNQNTPGSSGTKHDPESITRRFSSKSPGRKAASAQIAKIPFELARHIARVFHPQREEQNGVKPALAAKL